MYISVPWGTGKSPVSWAPPPEFDSVGLTWSPSICTPNKLPGDALAPGPRPTLGVTMIYINTEHCIMCFVRTATKAKGMQVDSGTGESAGKGNHLVLS